MGQVLAMLRTMMGGVVYATEATHISSIIMIHLFLLYNYNNGGSHVEKESEQARDRRVGCMNSRGCEVYQQIDRCFAISILRQIITIRKHQLTKDKAKHVIMCTSLILLLNVSYL